MKTFKFKTLAELKKILDKLPDDVLTKPVISGQWNAGSEVDGVLTLLIDGDEVEIIGDGRGVV